MTTATYTHPAAAGSTWQRLSNLTTGWAERRAQHRAYHTTVRELSAMSGRDLTDIGVHPADIHAIARQAAYGA